MPPLPGPARQARLSPGLRLALLAGLPAAAAIVAAALPRIAQSPGYHAFADPRPFFGVPNFLDVATNALLLAAGLAGILVLLRARPSASPRPAPGAWWASFTTFAGATLTSLGSGWYHLDPTTPSLFWDRLPMTVVFMGFTAWMVSERINDLAGARLLAPLLVAGAASVVWWRVTEAAGDGDLRWYAVVQYLPVLQLPLILWLFPAPWSATRSVVFAILLYPVAKVCELLDAEIFATLRIVSGHSLKHVAAATSVALLARHAQARFGTAGTLAQHLQFRVEGVLKADLFGRVEAGVAEPPGGGPVRAVRRDFRDAAFWLRPVAAILAAREAAALRRLDAVDGVPHLLARRRGEVFRTWIPGQPMHEARPCDPAYFREARQLLRRVHRAGVTHNDTHKEPNWLVTPDGRPALVDFQLASRFRRRTSWFRLCVQEDLRHLLKHKRTYCPEALTSGERALLRRHSWPARWWRLVVKPVYAWFTRRVLRWRDREGRG